MDEAQQTEYRYEFTVTGISAEDSRDLMDLILEFVDEAFGQLAGGVVAAGEGESNGQEE